MVITPEVAAPKFRIESGKSGFESGFNRSPTRRQKFEPPTDCWGSDILDGVLLPVQGASTFVMGHWSFVLCPLSFG